MRNSMDACLFFVSSLSLLSIILFFQLSYAQGGDDDDVHYTSCSPFNCGNLTNISYPFWTDHRGRPSYCGYGGTDAYKLEQCEDENQAPLITIRSQQFRLLDLKSQYGLNWMSIQRVGLGENTTCPEQIMLDDGLFNYTGGFAETITLSYDCRGLPSTNQTFPCKKQGTQTYALFFENNGNYRGECRETVQVPVEKVAWTELVHANVTTLDRALFQPFDVRYFAFQGYCPRCKQSGGRCGSDPTSPSAFACYCPDRPQLFQCQYGRNGLNIISARLGLGLGAALLGVLATCIMTTCFRRMCLYFKGLDFGWKLRSNDQDIEIFIRNNGSLAPKRYSYSEVKKMTNSFKEQLGKGGYGSVYKGKLLDGHLVAIKLLNTSKGNGQEFINEVASISRTSHVNVVTLLGFCLEGQKRALVYEFMPNGSLERFIYKGNMNLKDNKRQLEPTELYRIAIGIARGLEYLHRGCNTRILHFDIKPHNILLDENFCPKISDFGLSKLCTTNESFVSMVEARGTIGYIAPEVFCRNIGVVSYRSDVYSYGMMILEMVGGRRNVDVEVSQTSEIYFPHWIHRHLEQGNIEPISSLGLITEEETQIARKMMVVGLWCIQTNPANRPSMTKVIEMLEGSNEALEIPPRPYLSSPPRSPMQDSASTSLS